MPQDAPPYSISEWTYFLRQVPIFQELEEDSLREVAKKLQPLSLPKGATLYREGDPGDALYIMQSGRVRILTSRELEAEDVKGGSSGKERTLNFLGRGETFGETSLLTGARRSVTVKVDAPTNFLVLYKKDFEIFLKKNPAASYYLSRLIAQRLMAASRPTQTPVSKPQVLGFYTDAEAGDEIVFMVNMGLALTEQTRRKVLLWNLNPHGADLVQSLGMKPILSSAGMLSSEDLRNREVLKRITQVHPSGMEILTIPPETFSRILFRSLPMFLETLRDLYDYIIVDMKGTNASEIDEISRTVLQECDSIHYVFKTFSPRLDSLKAFLKEIHDPEGPDKIRKILLQEEFPAKPLAFFPDYSVPWSKPLLSGFLKGGRPYLTGPQAEPALCVLNRIARAIGKLQVGIAMGSGAAYGYTLIGILRILEREKIPIDFISGTSMGALIGSFYAAGKSVDEIEEIAHSITKTWLRKNFLSDLNLPWPHGGILMGHTLSRFLKGVLGESEFKDLKTRFSCTATDIMTGDGILLKEGKVWEAVRASTSLPFIFRPYKLGSRFLVDGGIVNPVPTAVLASMGADILISVNLTGKVSERKVSLKRMGMFPAKSPGLFNIFFKMIYTMQYQIASLKADLSQIVLKPDTRNFSWVDFHKARQIIPLGEETAEEALTKIKSRLPYFQDYCRFPIHRRNP